MQWPKPQNKALLSKTIQHPLLMTCCQALAKPDFFSVADIKTGFWHVQLDDASSNLTTSGTPWGRYRWLRLPIGISPSSYEFQRRLEESL